MPRSSHTGLEAVPSFRGVLRAWTELKPPGSSALYRRWHSRVRRVQPDGTERYLGKTEHKLRRRAYCRPCWI